MPDTEPPTYSAFIGARLLRAGPLPDVALAVQIAATQAREPILVFADATGAVVGINSAIRTLGGDSE